MNYTLQSMALYMYTGEDNQFNLSINKGEKEKKDKKKKQL